MFFYVSYFVTLLVIIIGIACSSQKVSRKTPPSEKHKKTTISTLHTPSSSTTSSAKKKLHKVRHSALKTTSATDVPTTSINVPLVAQHWHILKYNRLPPHVVRFVGNKMHIFVRKSASPIIYHLTLQNIISISITGNIDRLVNITPPINQGEKNWDDFNLRLGLVLLGNKTLNWLERQIAPQWIKYMYDLAPKNQGINYIHFLNAVISPQLLNKSRTHPLSTYIKEHYTWLMDKTGAFSYSYHFAVPKQTVGLWLSVDGDDTQSHFDLSIHNISFKTQN